MSNIIVVFWICLTIFREDYEIINFIDLFIKKNNKSGKKKKKKKKKNKKYIYIYIYIYIK